MIRPRIRPQIPYIRPTFRFETEEARPHLMTLAIGFNCAESIVIVTDTLIAVPGVSKLHGSKLFRHTPDNGVNSLIATAGHFSFGRMTMQHLQAQFSELRNTSQKKIRGIIEGEILKLHERYLYPHPDRLSLTVELLIAVWSPMDSKAAIYWTEDEAVVEFPGYACIGCGSTTGHYIIKPKYTAKMAQKQTVALAIEAVNKAKEFVDGVGGYTDWATLSTKDGTVSETTRVPDLVL
jgi:20S proteasome alpha/beta subunit